MNASILLDYPQLLFLRLNKMFDLGFIPMVMENMDCSE